MTNALPLHQTATNTMYFGSPRVCSANRTMVWSAVPVLYVCTLGEIFADFSSPIHPHVGDQDPHLIQCSLGPQESAPQTEPRSVQRLFCSEAVWQTFVGIVDHIVLISYIRCGLKQLLAYTVLNLLKLKPALGDFYTILTWDGLGYSTAFKVHKGSQTGLTLWDCVFPGGGQLDNTVSWCGRSTRLWWHWQSKSLPTSDLSQLQLSVSVTCLISQHYVSVHCRFYVFVVILKSVADIELVVWSIEIELVTRLWHRKVCDCCCVWQWLLSLTHCVFCKFCIVYLLCFDTLEVVLIAQWGWSCGFFVVSTDYHKAGRHAAEFGMNFSCLLHLVLVQAVQN